MILKNGSDMALPATIKAVGFADQFNPATNSDAVNAVGTGPSSAGRVNQPGPVAQGGAVNAPGGSIGSGGGDPALYAGGRMPGGATGGTPGATNTMLPFNAQGAIGMSGVSLEAGTQDSILIAKKKNVKLDSGMQMILKTD